MKKNSKKILIVLLLVVLIGIGYAALVSNLNINGYANMKSNYFDIHFDNVTYNEGNVIINTLNGEYNATIDPNDNTIVNYSVALSKPGDLYEFNVDAVNNGTIEGEIAEIISTLKINNDEPFVIEEDGSNLPDYLEYNLTYLDGTQIEANHTLESGEKVTYKVRLKFKEDIEPEDLPKEVKVLAFGMRSMYRQAPKMASTSSNTDIFALTPGKYSGQQQSFYLGQTPPVELYDTAEAAIADWGTRVEEQTIGGNWPMTGEMAYLDYYELPPIYMKFVLEGDKISQGFIEFQITNLVHQEIPGSTIGTYEVRGGVDESNLAKANRLVYIRNKNILNKAFGIDNCYEDDYDNDYGYTQYQCSTNTSSLWVYVDTKGKIEVGIPGDWPKCYTGEPYDENPAYFGCYY